MAARASTSQPHALHLLRLKGLCKAPDTVFSFLFARCLLIAAQVAPIQVTLHDVSGFWCAPLAGYLKKLPPSNALRPLFLQDSRLTVSISALPSLSNSILQKSLGRPLRVIYNTLGIFVGVAVQSSLQPVHLMSMTWPTVRALSLICAWDVLAQRWARSNRLP